LREVAADQKAAIEESDIRSAGLAVAKRAYSMYKRESYEAVLLVAALRGEHHATELAGGDLILSIHPSVQALLAATSAPRERRIDREVSRDVVERLLRISEFRKAYEPEE